MLWNKAITKFRRWGIKHLLRPFEIVILFLIDLIRSNESICQISLLKLISDGSQSLAPSSNASYVRLAFKNGGQKLFNDKLREAVTRKLWDVRVRKYLQYNVLCWKNHLQKTSTVVLKPKGTIWRLKFS